jgi:hypothetical protein
MQLPSRPNCRFPIRAARWRRWGFLFVLALFVLPIGVSCVMPNRDHVPWYEARRDSSGQAPDPAATPAAVVQVYAARAVGWRGILGVHTWIAVKAANAARFTRYEVMGWGVDRGAPAVRMDRTGPDNYWFGARPVLILDRRGPEVESMIRKIRAAVADYPYPHEYRLWPGPNSNSFTAFVGRRVPELGLDLPSTAIGKDYLPEGAVFAVAPSGTGYQLSLFGVAGVLVAADEGLEVNLLGLSFGLDLRHPALKLPGVGRLGTGVL